jgi:hypothetical protein
MKTNKTILNDAEVFVTNLLQKETPEKYSYHTLEHTKDVVENAVLIGTSEGLTTDEMDVLRIAAWFHDTGYVKTYQGHEAESAKIADNFLTHQNVDPQNAVYLTDKVLCDADLMHLGEENYFELATKLFQEQKNAGIRILSKAEFEKKSVKLFEAHSFYTDYCKNTLDETKAKNLEQLKERIKKREEKAIYSKKYSRGVDSMFKLTARNQINLSQIADNKSNILISLNGIIISIALVTLVSKFKQESTIIIPTVIFILFSLSTIVLAILSTRPYISKRKFTKDDIQQQKVNLLFFGNFYQMSPEDYEMAISEMIDNNPYLYSTLTKDQYSLGKVLARKYKLLHWAYNVFMVGLIITVAAFLFVFI